LRDVEALLLELRRLDRLFLAGSWLPVDYPEADIGELSDIFEVVDFTPVASHQVGD
jgi:hypothetical protein